MVEMQHSRILKGVAMDRFQAIKMFQEVVSQGGFAAAARHMNSSPPSVSRLISELEADLGVRLFSRTSRGVSLTEEGEYFLRRGVALVDELDAVSDELRERKNVPAGHLRITSVVAFGQERVAPAIPAFMDAYPKVSVELEISNRKVDLVQEHFDLAIRIGTSDGLDSSSLKARKIFSQRLFFVATSEYLARKGRPKSLDDLSDHLVAKQISGSWGRTNRFNISGETVTYNLPETFVVNSPNAARNAVLNGGAIGLIADYLVQDLISQGHLERVMPDLETLEQPIYAVFVHRNYMPAKVRAFIDHMTHALGRS